jgi:hypothetical protein
MKDIGGYFEIEFSNIMLGNLHSKAIKLNTARNCLEYIILANGYKKVYIPYYTCDVILEPIIKNNIEYSFYKINELLEIDNFPELKSGDALIYTNYFGIKGKYVRQITQRNHNIIIDNSQALFEPAVENIDTFYSLRKFVGVADGSYLYTLKTRESALESANSASRISHLYLRKDSNARSGYSDFKTNDASLSNLPISTMSSSTMSFVNTYDFQKNRAARERNFLYLFSKLNQLNQLNCIDVSSLRGPLCFPLLLNSAIKNLLIDNGVFIPTYWPNVKGWIADGESFEHKLVDHLICLPIDQRYGLQEMEFVCKLILE